jgi:hypothetical protein
MGTTPSSVKKTNALTNGIATATLHWDRRSCRRSKLTLLVRVRPADPSLAPFEDNCSTRSVSETGVYFRSKKASYEVGMHLFLSVPDCNEPEAAIREYLTKVVRRDSLPNGQFGVGVKILSERGL